MQTYLTNSETETEAIGALLAKTCSDGDFIALYGEMGSGKTVFMRGFVGALIPSARVSSPTYAILNVYEGEGKCVNHFDLYRITSEEDLLSTGFEEVIQRGITVCEWSENLQDLLPDQYLRVSFEKRGDTGRKISVERICYDDPGN